MSRPGKRKIHEAKVVLFNRVVNGKDPEEEHGTKGRKSHAWHHRHGHGSVFWGFLLIFTGAVLFLNSVEIIPWTVWQMLQRFWPVLLILLGVETLLGKSPASRIVTLVLMFCIFATVFGVLILNSAPDLLMSLPLNLRQYLETVNLLLVQR